MSPLARFSLVVTAPVVLLLALLGPVLLLEDQREPLSGGGEGGPAEPEGVAADDEVAALQKPAARLHHRPTSLASGTGAGVRFIPNNQVLSKLSKAPWWFPKELKGVTWLDQSGAYGYADLGKGSLTSLAVSYGSKDVRWNPLTKVMQVGTAGSSWTWTNSAKSYSAIGLSRKLRFTYEIRHTQDLSFAQIVPFLKLPLIGKIYIPISVVNFTMTTLTPKPGACPPKPGATKLERSQCAVARRESQILSSSPFAQRVVGKSTYYVFQIGDENHNPTQPYFDEYLKHANAASEPDPEAFEKEFGVTMPDEGKRHDVSMVSMQG